MKISYSIRILSFIAFIGTLVLAVISGADYWQAMAAGALFGIWMLLMGVEE